MVTTNLEYINTVNIVPCHNCICVPICRLRSFRDIYFKCELIRNLFGNKDYPDEIGDYKYLWLEEALKPTTWYVNCELTRTGGFTASVEPKK